MNVNTKDYQLNLIVFDMSFANKKFAKIQPKNRKIKILGL
ncbi:hypothetical protein CAMRE0001_2754 [Campylobacter rectus RM3267]|uniref:Uncharacterized protein n=1 Tax=Campylobacter rectus RM3267 TaxID=553218 RepID=B9D0V5_CAMRE|nr:hypothetical protein CAMRE0001_2754 [Campylobacter rectus RM3267]